MASYLEIGGQREPLLGPWKSCFQPHDYFMHVFDFHLKIFFSLNCFFTLRVPLGQLGITEPCPSRCPKALGATATHPFWVLGMNRATPATFLRQQFLPLLETDFLNTKRLKVLSFILFYSLPYPICLFSVVCKYKKVSLWKTRAICYFCKFSEPEGNL